MKRYVFLMACSASVLFSCNEETKKTTTVTDPVNTTTPATTTASAEKECYSKISGKDSVQLSYTVTDNIVNGELLYNYFEKDKNTGTIKGKFSGDTLVAEYSFKSEGMMSVREVAFIKKGNLLVEGYGDSEDKGGKMVFKKIGNLKFDEKSALQKINCN